jgi:hypothetical protein
MKVGTDAVSNDDDDNCTASRGRGRCLFANKSDLSEMFLRKNKVDFGRRRRQI